jgi:hypothetical protein
MRDEHIVILRDGVINFPDRWLKLRGVRAPHPRPGASAPPEPRPELRAPHPRPGASAPPEPPAGATPLDPNGRVFRAIRPVVMPVRAHALVIPGGFTYAVHLGGFLGPRFRGSLALSS